MLIEKGGDSGRSHALMADIERANEVVEETRHRPECIEATERKLRIMSADEKAARSNPVFVFCPEYEAKYQAAMR
jgi:hypothetical protein